MPLPGKDDDNDDDDVPPTRESEKDEEDADAWKYAIATCMVAGLIILLVALVLVFGSSSRTATKERVVDSKGGSGGKEKGDGSGPLSASGTKLPAHAPGGTTESIGDILLLGSTTTQPPMPTELLLCTVRSSLKRTTKFPDDGLCDIIFYDSLFEKGHINPLGGPYNEGFNYFLDMAGRFEKTESGTGLEFPQNFTHSPYAYINKTNAAVRDPIFQLWSRKIYHFAIFDVSYMCYKYDCNLPYLQALRAIFDILEGRRSPKRPCYLVYSNIFTNRLRDLDALAPIKHPFMKPSECGTGENIVPLLTL